MDDIRAQLDALMGQDRDVPLHERDKHRRERKYSDPDICKYYILGFCPYEEFRRTKNDCGDCPNLRGHDEACRKQWEGLDERTKERTGYEADLLKWFDRLLGDLRKRVDANSRRLETIETPAITVEDQQRLDNLTGQINALLARAAELGEQGEVDASQAATTDAERLKVQRSLAEQQAQSRALARVGGNLKQKVCPISGLIINDEESRLQDHYSGRNYNAWKKMHDVHAQLLEAVRKRRGGSGPGVPPSMPPLRDAPSGYRSDRSDRDRDRQPRRRSRSRDRQRRRSRSRDRGGRDRSRDRYARSSRRSRSRERRRERSRERSRSRDRRRRSPGANVEYKPEWAAPPPGDAAAPEPGEVLAEAAGPAAAEPIPTGAQLPNVPPQGA